MAVLVVGCRARVVIQLKLLMWAALVVYYVELYTDINMVAQHWGLDHSVAVILLVARCVQALAVTAAVISESSKQPPSEEEEVLKQALLGADVEAPAAKQKRPWYQLMFTAIMYVWPRTPLMQLRAGICVLAIAVMRLLNLAVPILYRDVVNTLADASSAAHPRAGDKPEFTTFWHIFYPYALLYMVAAFFQGGAGTGATGLLNNLRSYLWIPIAQNAFRSISVDVFSKTLDLDLRWHLMRKTGEVTRIMDRGTSAIQNVLSTGPATSASNALLEGYWDMNKYDNARGARVTDALLNYETVKCFNNEELEKQKLEEAIINYQKVEYKLMASLNGLNMLQSIIIFSGLIAGLVVCTKGVAEGRLTVGDAVLFITLMQQLYAPLNYFGSYYRTIQQQLIDMENCFDLLGTSPSLTDKPGAKDLVASKCSVEFDNVSFSYHADRPVVKGISFYCPGGQTLALVGSGKSSALRLLFRFYDPTSGVIRVDGQDISEVTQASLRANMAVVPQDTVLFNDTILHNIQYGRPSATDEEVYEAAEAASIHESITTRFPQGYDTIVGERGLRLSGGEKQRVAFARAILKNPRILLLDEATSSLDSLTERRIQDALAAKRSGRTTIIVAHRLSTIMDADVIIVMKEGDIVERGTHQQLVQMGGLYAEMWTRQAEAAVVEELGTADEIGTADDKSNGDVSEMAAAHGSSNSLVQ
ncbi:ATP-binding cassette sub-family B member 6, mitochondrial [Coccomyxa sp. Obi]|nr:ATP-binding cassette sub-family B member 6, mitochondrial [Coccomyxa sp. Obi]